VVGIGHTFNIVDNYLHIIMFLAIVPISPFDDVRFYKGVE